jgi:hypothetical protein
VRRPAVLVLGLLVLQAGTLLRSGSADRAAPPPARDVVLRLFLIGDAGDPDEKGEPVLEALERELAQDPARSVVVFLGDNVYPSGLPPVDARNRGEMERRLDRQVDAVTSHGARAIFVPGNHDWDKEEAGGWEAVRRQAAHVLARGGALVDYRPRDGCPGPEVVDLHDRVRLVALDTQWWLHEGPKPQDPTSSCAADSRDEVLAALRGALREADGREVVVAAHHPLATGGPHGGYFSFRAHVFPLTDVHKGLWLPLPFVGSLYPLSRKGGVSAQDIDNAKNRAMREALETVLRERPPLAFASGHEHALQVITSPSSRRLLVSGAGIFGHTSSVRRVKGGLFASSAAGFMRLDFPRDGPPRLAVLGVDARARLRELYAEWIEEAVTPPPPGRR